jgi:ferredoxin
MIREVIRIDEEKCDGCGLCIPGCPEGALQMIDGKARLVGDLFCDGLGACIGHCPRGAITIERREAEPYSERTVMERIVSQGENTVRAHLEHLMEHGRQDLVEEAIDYLIENDITVPAGVRAAPAPDEGIGSGRRGTAVGPAAARHVAASGQTGVAECGCPGSRVIDMNEAGEHNLTGEPSISRPSRLRQWPVQIMLVPPFAPYLNDADLLIAADCVPFAHPDFHDDLLRGRALLVGCPKLDNAGYYVEKLTSIFEQNRIKSITVAHMEVPCCFGMMKIVTEAVAASGKSIPVEDVTIGIRGDRK